ncbi:GPI inositol-deacylase [Aeromonas allosaccharophila]|uniref:esterase/lipase family protein n=1 Tax=Aeromonas allosaccharophila TaxID=656 RepID=UPI0013CCC799|nr:alpha/beta hydrolase [Aeromonas allosaccharophila]WDO00855.1 GPI inositol-deacylase [Aeromonas allosaccharophila]
MTDTTEKSPSSWHISDIRELAQLLTLALPAAVEITEAVHQAVLSGMGIKGRDEGKTSGITGLVYKGVHGAANTLGSSINGLLTRLPPTPPLHHIPETPKRAALIATLNGVMGDALVESHNALATPMTLRYQGEPLDWQAMPTELPRKGRVLLMVHGLCMNDLQWQTLYQGEPVNHGEQLANALGYQPLYVRYNSGLSIAQNGLALALLLEQLLTHWPGDLKEITIMGYSMGGLVARSACHHASQAGLIWPAHLANLIFLGTPHHGAPLEHAGHWLEQLLPASAYTEPFVRLTRLRSTGIKDLRHGKVIETLAPPDPAVPMRDPREPLPLPCGVNCYAIAATTAAKRSLLADRLIGDGLVPLRSALGQHSEARHQLAFLPAHTLIVYRTSHMALLGSPQVGQQLLRWLTPHPA